MKIPALCLAAYAAATFLTFSQTPQSAEAPNTSADVSELPPEFLRKGRFDELFFVDLPDANEPEQIWTVVCGCDQR